MPAYFDAGSDGNRWIYYAGNGDHLKAFRLTNGLLSTSPSSQSPGMVTFGYPGATPIVSANGTTNGIVWAVQQGGTAVLHAYDALNLANELYNSNQAAGNRDHFGASVKFATPTVAGGKVFIGTTNGLAVFGLFNQPKDPGFEKPSLGTGPSAYQYNPSGSPWTFTGGAGVSGNGSDFTGGNPDAPEGTQVAFLQGVDANISQSVTFAAGTYSVSFLAAQRNFNDSSQTFQVLIDNTVVGTFTPPDFNYAAYNTGSFTVTAGAHTIRFVGLDPAGGDNTAFLDLVRVNRVVASLNDPGFETPNVGTGPGAYQYNPTSPYWTYTGAAGVAGNGSELTVNNPNAPEGTQVAFLQGVDASIIQSVTFVAGTYSLSFSAAQSAFNVNPQTFRVLTQVQHSLGQ